MGEVLAAMRKKVYRAPKEGATLAPCPTKMGRASRMVP